MDYIYLPFCYVGVSYYCNPHFVCLGRRSLFVIQYGYNERGAMCLMNKTHIRPARDLRNNYAQLAKIVKEDGDHVVLTNRGHGEAVLIGFKDYALYEEYLHQKYVEEKLKEAIKQAQSSDAKWMPGEDVIYKMRAHLSQLEDITEKS